MTDARRVQKAQLIAANPAEDASMWALRDVAEVMRSHPESCVVGGRMMSVLSTLFANDKLVPRYTNDADIGVSTELATSGQVHDEMTAFSYIATGSNRYERVLSSGEPAVIDVLAPHSRGFFGRVERGGREFDAVPSLDVAIGRSISVEVAATLSDLSELSFCIRVPDVESAVVLKAYAWKSRRDAGRKDVIDLHNLFAILTEFGPERINGWALGEAQLRGSRKDAAAILHELAGVLERSRASDLPFDRRRLVELIRKHVTR